MPKPFSAVSIPRWQLPCAYGIARRRATQPEHTQQDGGGEETARGSGAGKAEGTKHPLSLAVGSNDMGASGLVRVADNGQ